MVELFFRFAIGGMVVSAFAILGDLFRPKSFAGLFGAAPSLALATLALTIASDGPSYATVEARSMTGGAVAFCIYACCVSYVLMRYRFKASVIASLLIVLWAGVSMSLWALWLRGAS
jgi:uncharacterized membrane protein (GlpM family)